MKNKYKLGFTLIELLVSIGIIGILSSVSVATFKGYIKKAHLAKTISSARESDRSLVRKVLLNELGTIPEFLLNKIEADGTIQSSNGNEYLTNNPGRELTMVNEAPYKGEHSVSSDWGYADGTISLELPDEAITIAFWVYIKESTSSTSFYPVSGGSGGSIYPGFMFGTGGEQEKSFFAITGAPGQLDKLEGNKKLKEKMWHYLEGSYDGTNMYYYVDGEYVGTRTSSKGLPASLDYLKVGHTSSTTEQYIYGLKIYPTVKIPKTPLVTGNSGDEREGEEKEE
jgi:prepilin-type N-terminal cleavage/methylation domain-containing protein